LNDKGNNMIATCQEPRDVREALAQLKSTVTLGTSPHYCESAFSVVEKALQNVLDEHNGMGEELLAAYELLGVVFEVTRRLSVARDESQVLDVFVDGLQRSYVGYEVFARATQTGESEGELGSKRSNPVWIDANIERAFKENCVLVVQVPAGIINSDIVQIMVGPVVVGDECTCVIVVARSEQETAFRACDMTMVEALCNYCGDVIRNHRLVLELRGISLSMVRALVNAVDQKDEYTSGHSVRVGYFSLMLGRRVNLTGYELQMLQWSALLHDVGKIGIRDEVLKKEGKLTDEEFTHMKEHPERSYQVVKEIPKLADALPGVLHHHEKYNGKGYPSGLKGEDIPLQARLIQIADIFDALTSNRSYRNAYSWQEALGILDSESGQTCDPKLTAIFIAMMKDHLSHDETAWSSLMKDSEQFLHETDSINDSIGLVPS